MPTDGTHSRPRRIGRVLVAAVVFIAGITVGGLTLSPVGAEALPGYAPRDGGLATPAESAAPTTDRPASDAVLNRSAVERSVHAHVNRERIERGLPPLRMDRDLRAIARNHSLDMATRDYVNHSTPGGETMADRYAAAGIHCRVPIMDGGYATGAENIVYVEYKQPNQDPVPTIRSQTATRAGSKVVALWMNSSRHRANLLKPYWNAEGIGVQIETTDSTIQLYVTQNFC